MHRHTTHAAIAAVLGLAGAAHAQISYNPIGDFAVSDQSADGTWLAGKLGNNIARWSADTGFETLYVDANFNGSVGISDDGSRVTGTIYDSEGTAVPGVWTEGVGWVTTGPITGGGVPGEDGSAYAISGDGSTITGLAWRSDWRARAFSWTESTGMVNLGSSYDDRSSRGTAINGDGSVIGGFDEAPFGNRRAALWIDGQLTLLEPDSEEWTEVIALNAAGDVAGGTGGYFEGAKIWTLDGNDWSGTSLGFLPPEDGDNVNDREAVTLGVSADGTVAVGFNRYGFGPFANYNGFLWTETGMVDIEDLLTDNGVDFGGLDIRGLLDISDDGSIITGWGYYDGFNVRAFQIIFDTPCDADFNGDDTVNTLDVLAFLNAWTAGEGSADFNDDGSVNTLDVLAFLNAWTAGC
ncbi:MAG: hypothetical protein HND58_03535 [Planctomycetota bacterium]|nr:MAG: hypothetical protein HND58_03535 [Planctomycetota bacterium]